MYDCIDRWWIVYYNPSTVQWLKRGNASWLSCWYRIICLYRIVSPGTNHFVLNRWIRSSFLPTLRHTAQHRLGNSFIRSFRNSGQTSRQAQTKNNRVNTPLRNLGKMNKRNWHRSMLHSSGEWWLKNTSVSLNKDCCAYNNIPDILNLVVVW